MEKDIKVLQAITALQEEQIISNAQANAMWNKHKANALKKEQEENNRLVN